MEERRKRVVLCGKLFSQIETSEGFDSVVKRINRCLAGLEKKKMDDISSQIINVLNGKDERKKDILIKLLEFLDDRIREELVYCVCYNCDREFSYRECCKIKIYEGFTTRELFDNISVRYDLSPDEILEKSKKASIILNKKNGALEGLIHIFERGIPSLNKTKVR